MVGWPPIDSSQLTENAVNNRALAPAAVGAENLANPNINGIFGDGSDGQVVQSANDAQGGNVYQATEFVVEDGVTLGLENAPLVVFATERIVISGTVNGKGDGAPPGHPAADGAILGSDAAGGNDVSDGQAGHGTAGSGGGMSGDTGPGGDAGGGTLDPTRAINWRDQFHWPHSSIIQPVLNLNPYIAAGGGHGGDNVADGGSGGPGGSGVVLVAPRIEGAGTITVAGVDGGDGGTYNKNGVVEGAGGGGGGHGGVIGLFARELATDSLTTNVSGGAGGAGGSTSGKYGGNGGDGPDGVLSEVSL